MLVLHTHKLSDCQCTEPTHVLYQVKRREIPFMGKAETRMFVCALYKIQGGNSRMQDKRQIQQAADRPVNTHG